MRAKFSKPIKHMPNFKHMSNVVLKVNHMLKYLAESGFNIPQKISQSKTPTEGIGYFD